MSTATRVPTTVADSWQAPTVCGRRKTAPAQTLVADPWRSLRELTVLTGVPLGTLRAAAASRAFPTVRLSPQGRYRARVRDVEAWLTNQTIPAQAPARPVADLENLLPPGVEPDGRLL